MTTAKKLAFGRIAAPTVGLTDYEDLYLFGNALSAASEDFGEYSFYGVPTDIFGGLRSGGKVSQLDLNAMGKKKKFLPCYLFRAYGPSSGGVNPNGPYKDLNSKDAITCYAFHMINGVITGHKSASKIPDPAAMINGHIDTDCDIRLEFSSWSPSLLIVLCIAELIDHRQQSAHICVLDTYKIRNGVYHFPNLIHAGLVTGKLRGKPVGGFTAPYPEEYLVHGVVSGPAYVALPYDKVREDLYKVYPVIRNNHQWGFNIRCAAFALGYQPVKITDKHVKLLKSIAKGFDRPELVYPLTVYLICMTKRFNLKYTTQDLLRSPDFAFYGESLRSIVTHTDLTDNWLVNDHQFTEEMLDVKHTKAMMRALIWRKYGRGKRNIVEEIDAEDLPDAFEGIYIYGKMQERVKEAKE